jgi:hypothetical protein
VARLFASASSQSLSVAAAVIPDTEPFTFAAWFKPTTSAAVMSVLNLGDGGTTNFMSLGIDATGHARTFIQGGSASTSAGTVTNGTWAHLAAVFTSTSLRQAFLNAVGATTDTTLYTPFTANKTEIGIIGTLDFANGAIAEAGIWNVALTQDEITALAAGVPPLLIRPGSLKGYWPLWGDDSPEPDYNPNGTLNNLSLVNAPTKADHAPVTPWWEPFLVNDANAPIVIPVTTSLAGTLTMSGTVAFQRSRVKALAGTLTLSGVNSLGFLFRKILRNRYTIGLDPERLTIRG